MQSTRIMGMHHRYRWHCSVKLLLSISLSIAELTEQSGYGDYRTFTKVFKSQSVITPSQYRRDFLEETGTSASERHGLQ